jgi:hypothetical protein
MYDMVMYNMSMYDMVMYDIECTAPSADYAFYGAYRPGSWAGAGARAHRGLRSAVT